MTDASAALERLDALRDAGLPDCDHPGRRRRLRDALDAEACDAFVVSDLTNIRYLTGFTGSNAVVFVGPDGWVFVTDGRYRDQAAEQLSATGFDAGIVVTNDPDAALGAAARGITRIGLEADVVAWATQRRWAATVVPWAHLVPTEGLLLGHRAVKDDGEVARLALAAAIADVALERVAPLLHEAPTELDVARALEDEMVGLGAAGPSFETIVAAGPNGAKPHARPTDRVIGTGGDGELVVIDFGALVDGYHSDMTRTLAVGTPTATQERMLDVVRTSQAAGVAAVAAGVRTAEVDATCRAVIDDAGWGDAFIHGTGHGIGLVIHEQPRLNDRSTDVLAPGHCVTVEPGVYLPEHGGVRVEDSVVVTATGSRFLTAAPYT